MTICYNNYNMMKILGQFWLDALFVTQKEKTLAGDVRECFFF